ncbi:helix-turn-helix domain-containing protein [Catenulispora yoronensis]
MTAPRDDEAATAGEEPWQPPLSEYAVYMTPAEEHRRLGLAIYGAGWHTIAEHGIRWDARVLNCYALHLVTRGSGWIEWGDRPRTRLPIRAPAAFWLFPGLVHSYQPDAGGWTITWALFDGPAAPGYESLDFLSRTSPVVPLSDARPVRELFRELLTIVRTAGPPRSLRRHSDPPPHHRRPRQRPGLRESRAVRTLTEHAMDPVALQDHATRLGLTVAQLREEVRLATGSTPKEYILRVRLSKAKDLLAATDQSVVQIARAVGYDDPAYFTRLFTQRVGLSPTMFRRGSLAG